MISCSTSKDKRAKCGAQCVAQLFDLEQGQRNFKTDGVVVNFHGFSSFSSVENEKVVKGR